MLRKLCNRTNTYYYNTDANACQALNAKRGAKVNARLGAKRGAKPSQVQVPRAEELRCHTPGVEVP